MRGRLPAYYSDHDATFCILPFPGDSAELEKLQENLNNSQIVTDYSEIRDCQKISAQKDTNAREKSKDDKKSDSQKRFGETYTNT